MIRRNKSDDASEITLPISYSSALLDFFKATTKASL
jgi:hypothetical protein